jgi:GntR family transcriptional regulator, histidine utilization repressor
MVSTDHAPIAPYARVKQALKNGLEQGRWRTGDLMPSEAELVAQFGISRMTVNRALRELQAEGLVDRVQGVGTFAAQLHRISSTLTIRDLHEEIEARGHRHHVEVHLTREEAAEAPLARQLGLAVGTPVYHSLVVHHDNGIPLQCEDRYVNPACAPDYLKVDFTRRFGKRNTRSRPASPPHRRPSCSASASMTPAWWSCAERSAAACR